MFSRIKESSRFISFLIKHCGETFAETRGSRKVACGLDKYAVQSKTMSLSLENSSIRRKSAMVLPKYGFNMSNTSWPSEKVFCTGTFTPLFIQTQSFAKRSQAHMEIPKTDLLPTNEQITAKEVRFVDADGKNSVISIEEARQLALDANLDLVQVQGNAKPPVCKLMDYSRKRYEKKMRDGVRKADQRRSQITKEIRMRSTISEHDLKTKVAFMEKFLLKGYKCKACIIGKMSANGQEGIFLLNHIADQMKHCSKVEIVPKKESQRIVMILQGTGTKKDGKVDDDDEDEDDVLDDVDDDDNDEEKGQKK